MKNTLLLFFLIAFYSNIFAQKENNVWYFGHMAGIDFNSGTPVAITNGAIDQHEGCASICDSAGQILFYTDGVTIWNSTHSMMFNGDSLAGHFSATQSALILRKPLSKDIYYVFTVGIPYQTPNIGKFCYSIVDMTLDGGNGGVSLKNQVLNTIASEKLTATSHSNNSDYWITMHEYGYYNNTFKSFLLTATGISVNPVVSSTGPMIAGSGDVVGYMRFSPNGNKIAVTRPLTSDIILCDFDDLTGSVTNPIIITIPTTVNAVYGLEFSPNSRLLYAAIENVDILFQWDISSNDSSIINSTLYYVLNGPIHSIGGLSALQLGPDRKIYIGRSFINYLAVINSPNFSGANCDFRDSVINLGSGICKLGLPNSIYTSSLIINTNDFEQEINCKIYPNPSSGILKIESDEPISKISITNLPGELIEEELNTSTIDLSNNPPGIYFVTVFLKNGSNHKRKIILN